MTKQYKIIDNITTLYVFIMTFAVSFIISLVQSNDTNLSGKNLLIFLCGFWGSVICIIIRYYVDNITITVVRRKVIRK